MKEGKVKSSEGVTSVRNAATGEAKVFESDENMNNELVMALAKRDQAMLQLMEKLKQVNDRIDQLEYDIERLEREINNE